MKIIATPFYFTGSLRTINDKKRTAVAVALVALQSVAEAQEANKGSQLHNKLDSKNTVIPILIFGLGAFIFWCGYAIRHCLFSSSEETIPLRRL